MNRIFLPLLTLCVFWTPPALAFYSQEDGDRHQEARALLYTGIGVVDSEVAGELSARLMVNVDLSSWHIEYHQVAQQTFATQNHQTLQADRLNTSYSNEVMFIKLGRQAINLATTFYFSPNDFFAPFSVQILNRDYKQGVDAAYSEFKLGDLSQASAMLIQHKDANIEDSKLIRFESAWENMSWMILTGNISDIKQNNQRVLGASIQTDVFDSIGVRAEGHLNRSNNEQTLEWVFGLDYQWDNQLNLSGEWFHHGAKAPTSNLPYQASEYLALGLSYPFTPLLNGSLNLIRNIDDKSMLLTTYLNYSLSNESTLNISILLPKGESFSEFNAYPQSLGAEYQIYF